MIQRASDLPAIDRETGMVNAVTFPWPVATTGDEKGLEQR